MLDQAIVRTGIKYGVSCALAGFLVVLGLYFAGLNPYGQLTIWGWVFIPVAVFWGLHYFKKFNDHQLSFLKALKVGWSIAFYTALCSGMLLYVFSVVAGLEPIQRHITEMKMLMDASREAAMQSKVMTKEAFDTTYAQLDKTTPFMLAFDDFIKKFVVGILSAIVGAVFFRK